MSGAVATESYTPSKRTTMVMSLRSSSNMKDKPTGKFYKLTTMASSTGINPIGVTSKPRKLNLAKISMVMVILASALAISI